MQPTTDSGAGPDTPQTTSLLVDGTLASQSRDTLQRHENHYPVVFALEGRQALEACIPSFREKEEEAENSVPDSWEAEAFYLTPTLLWLRQADTGANSAHGSFHSSTYLLAGASLSHFAHASEQRFCYTVDILPLWGKLPLSQEDGHVHLFAFADRCGTLF